MRSTTLCCLAAAGTVLPFASAFMAPAAPSLSRPHLALSASSALSSSSFAPSLAAPLRSSANKHPRQARATLRMQMQPSDEAGDLDPQTYQDALRNTAIAVSAAVAFGAGVWTQMGPEAGLSWFTGYILEESLSVDNLFVFILLFNYFKVPRSGQEKVLTWGIAGAVIMRGLFIGAGIVAVKSFRPVLLAFAGFLVFSSYKMLASGGDDDDDDEDLSNNAVVKFASGVVQSTKTYDGDNFFTTVDGVKRATPLLLVVLCVELSDILFAVDSIPAIFGVTEDPFIIFTSNIFAILGLRALFQVVAKLMANLEYLEPAVAVVLGFVGLKMIAEFAGVEVSEEAALGVVATVLSAGVGASLVKNKQA
mmetsp:Transcript_27661/g.54009  ORF Transcript_27661/g.54009 Transcript_27661/m.54009 type:complete len:364 (+) Transcript_27661:153-1244(+)